MMEYTFSNDTKPEEALNGKLFVSLTSFDGSLWPSNVLVSHFDSRLDLIEALCASATIPFFTGSPLLGTFRGKTAIDGGLTLNMPVFKDNKNPQLIINLGCKFRNPKFAATLSNLVVSSNPYPPSLLLRSALDRP
jgi:predicted acylesterase/phospholipase RssA